MTKHTQRIIVIGTPLLCAAAFLFRDVILSNISLPPCPVYAKSGIYCPGCGNTRSVTALLHGDLLLALRNNITMPFLALIALLFYIETAAGLCGKKLHLLPRREAFWYTVLGIFIVYFVLRNFIPAIAPV